MGRYRPSRRLEGQSKIPSSRSPPCSSAATSPFSPSSRSPLPLPSRCVSSVPHGHSSSLFFYIKIVDPELAVRDSSSNRDWRRDSSSNRDWRRDSSSNRDWRRDSSSNRDWKRDPDSSSNRDW
ncbi:hypothetical protein DFH06DRAFT_495597 [Mycena polygramma]|nr:hypothetical protein DFH06DRAFT_495597 [Mycena polygramma]